MTTDPPDRRSTLRLVEVVHLGLLVVGLVALFAWWSVVLQATDPAEWRRDWYCFWETGTAVLGGQRTDLYTPDYAGASGYFWLYPPYALYPAALLGLLPPGAAYVVLTVLILGLAGGAVATLARASPRGRDDAATMALVFFASAPLNSVVVTGQNSAWWLAALVAGLVALEGERLLVAGVCFAVWGFKPNWVACLVVWLLVTRRWRVLAVVAACGVVLVAASMPLGPRLWLEFIDSTRALGTLVLDQSPAHRLEYPIYRLVSLHATLRSIAPPPLIDPLWWVGELVLIASAAVVWLRSRDLHRQLAALALFVLAGNAYAVFYDSLLLVVPAMVWWGRRDRYPLGHNVVIGGCLAATWLWLWVSLYGVVADPPSLVGGFLAVWLVTEALATRHLEAVSS